VPELPEVETVRRSVERYLTGIPIASIDNRLPKLLRDSPLADLDLLVGQEIVGARRRAKVLVVDFTSELSLVVHFKLAGQWAIFLPDGMRVIAGHPVPAPDGPYPHKSTHAEMRFTDGTIVYYSDIRQFGWWRLMPTSGVDDALAAFGFGPEGIGEELDVDALAAGIGRRRIPIKTLLLDQSFIAGLGNIYVDEVLHSARVHPARPAQSLADRERLAVLSAVPWALEEGIKQGGAKIIHSRAFPIETFPAVHGGAGGPGFHCGSSVEKIRVGR